MLKKFNKKKVKLILLCSIVTILPTKAVNFQQTGRSSSLTYEKLEDARTFHGHVKNDHDFIFSLGASTVDSPLVIKNTNKTSQLQTIINRINTIHLGLAFYPKEWLMLGLEGGFSQFKDFKGETDTGFNDFQVKSKFRLINKERFAFSVMPFIDIPSKQGDYSISGLPNFPRVQGLNFSVLSDQKFGFGFMGIAEYILSWAQIVLNVGYRENSGALIIDNSNFNAIDYRKQLITGIGAYIPFSTKWGVNVEWLRKWTTPFFTSAQAQNELFIGTAAGVTNNLNVFAGAGFGNMFSSNDGNDLRLIAGIKLRGRFRTKKKNPIKPVFVSDIIKNKQSSLTCSELGFFGKTDVAVIRFSKNQYELDQNDKNVQDIFHYISKNKKFIKTIYIEAHSSKTPLLDPTASLKRSYQHNLILSRKRLNSILTRLSLSGIPNEKINPKALGQKKAVDQKFNLSAHKKNRRAEILVVTNKDFEKNCNEINR